MSNHEIKSIVAELQSMSPRTQLEIVRLCKRVAELTPDYIEQLSQEDYDKFVALLNQAKAELQTQIDTTNANLTDSTETLQAAIDAINSSIRNITFDTEENKTRITGTLKTTIIETNRIIDDDSQILFGTNQGLVFKQGTHTMNYDNDGLLYLDGVQVQPVPNVPTYYRHVIGFAYNNTYFNFSFDSTKETAYTQAELREYLKQWNDGTLRSLSFQLTGINTASYAFTNAVLIINENDYYFYLGNSSPITLTNLGNYKDTCYEI